MASSNRGRAHSGSRRLSRLFFLPKKKTTTEPTPTCSLGLHFLPFLPRKNARRFYLPPPPPARTQISPSTARRHFPRWLSSLRPAFPASPRRGVLTTRWSLPSPHPRAGTTVRRPTRGSTPRARHGTTTPLSPYAAQFYSYRLRFRFCLRSCGARCDATSAGNCICGRNLATRSEALDRGVYSSV